MNEQTGSPSASPEIVLPRAVIFDLDNTLAQSKQPIEADMAATLARLLARTKVAITSGGMLAQLVKQVADRLPEDADRANLYLLPTSGAALFTFVNGTWQNIYEERLTTEEQEYVKGRVLSGARASGAIDFDAPTHGEMIELRGAEVTLSALGQQAPVEEKKAWDPTHAKREALRAAIAPLLPQYDVKIGGSTSVDVTKHGVNKAYGVRKLAEHLSLPIADMLYVGDELGAGGNDEVVKETGIRTRPVTGPDETRAFIEKMLAGA